MRVYLRAGLYAEGPSDYHFLCRLLDRLLDDLGAKLFPGRYEVADTLGIDDRPPHHHRRAERIARAIADHASDCELFVIHADGAGDPKGARLQNVEPGISAARAALPKEAPPLSTRSLVSTCGSTRSERFQPSSRLSLISSRQSRRSRTRKGSATDRQPAATLFTPAAESVATGGMLPIITKMAS